MTFMSLSDLHEFLNFQTFTSLESKWQLQLTAKQKPSPQCTGISVYCPALLKSKNLEGKTKANDTLTNSFSTNKCTVALFCISLLISSYMFWLNCHHQGVDTYIVKTSSNKTILHCLCISNVWIIVEIYNI